MLLRLIWCACLLLLSACGTVPSSQAPSSSRGDVSSQAPSRQGGGYYKDDGPGDNPPENLAVIPDALPRAEPLHRAANRPYSVFGVDYRPLQQIGTYKERGVASWYGKKFHGQKTSIGETYDMYAMTAAHPTLPLPSYARVTNLANGKSVVVRINDRGPFHAGRIIDLSYTAAWKLGLIGGGSGMVEVESLLPGAPPLPPVQLAGKSEEAVPAVTADNKTLPEIDDAGVGQGAWLQLGAFGNRDNAEALKSRLASELGDMGDKLLVRSADNLFRVQIGPWADAQEARGVAEKLADLLQITPLLVRP